MPKYYKAFVDCENLTRDERWKLAERVSKNPELDSITFEKEHDAIMGDGCIVTYYKGEGDKCAKQAEELKNADFDSVGAHWWINDSLISFHLGLDEESDRGLVAGDDETMVNHLAEWIKKLKDEL